MSSPTALITCEHVRRRFEQLEPEYRAHGVTPILPELDGQQFGAAEMARLVPGADVIIAGDDVIDRDVLRAGKESRLKAVIKWGIGVDAIDLAAAAELGLPVFNTPGAFSDEVADLAMSHLLLLLRGTHRMHASVLAGEWLKLEGRSLAGMCAGVIGLGSIGRTIARRARAFGMQALGYDVREIAFDDPAEAGVRQVDLETLYRLSDVVVVACALTSENRHLLSGSAFAQMKEGAYVINVARGPLIDQVALVSALAEGKIAGAGLDVFEEEPLAADDPLREFADRCVFTTHNASNTAEAVERTNRMATDILFDVLGVRKAEGFTPNRVA